MSHWGPLVFLLIKFWLHCFRLLGRVSLLVYMSIDVLILSPVSSQQCVAFFETVFGLCSMEPN
jgi:hypothetical protein